MMSFPPLATNCASAAFAAAVKSLVRTWMSATVSKLDSVAVVMLFSARYLKVNFSKESAGRPVTYEEIGITPRFPGEEGGMFDGINAT